MTEDSITTVESIIDQFSSRFSQFKNFEQISKFIIYPDLTKVDELDMEIFEWLKLENFEMQLIDFQSSAIWRQKFIDLRENLEIIERERLEEKINNIAESKIINAWQTIPEEFKSLRIF